MARSARQRKVVRISLTDPPWRTASPDLELLAPGSWPWLPDLELPAPGSWLLAPGSWLLALAPGSWLLDLGLLDLGLGPGAGAGSSSVGPCWEPRFSTHGALGYDGPHSKSTRFLDLDQ